MKQMKSVYQKVISRYPSYFIVSFVMLAGVVAALFFQARPGLVAPPFNGHPTKRLTIYDGTLLIDGTAQARIGNAGRDIESSGRLYLRPDGSKRGAFVEGSPDAVGQRLEVPGGINGQDTISATWNGEADTSSLLGAVAGHYSGAATNTSGSAVYGQVDDCGAGKTCYAGYFKGSGSIALSANNNDATQATIDVENSNASGVAAEFIGDLVTDVWHISGNTRDDAGSCSWEDLDAAGPAEWSALGSGLDNSVVESIMYNGELVVSGTFNQAGGVAAKKIAKWDGSTWSALDAGLQNCGSGDDNSRANSLAIYNGKLIAAGCFENAGGVAARNIAQWDGSTWSALGAGSRQVNDLTTYTMGSTEYLIIGQAGAAGIDALMRWDGAVWSAFPSWNPALGDSVGALAVYNDQLIVGGARIDYDGDLTDDVVSWDGSAWSIIGSAPGVNKVILSLRTFGTQLIVGGDFVNINGVVSANIIAWNGSAWSGMAGGLNNASAGGHVGELAVINGELYAGGYFDTLNNISHWNGTAWEAVGAGTNLPVYSLTVNGADLYIGGLFTQANGLPANYIARWSVPVPEQIQCGNGRYLAGVRNSATPPADTIITSLFCCEL